MIPNPHRTDISADLIKKILRPRRDQQRRMAFSLANSRPEFVTSYLSAHILKALLLPARLLPHSLAGSSPRLPAPAAATHRAAERMGELKLPQGRKRVYDGTRI